MRAERRNVLLLAICQAIHMTCTLVIITSQALAGYLLLEDKAWATLPVGLQFTMTMVTTIPASLLMARIGRRRGFQLGTVAQLVGGLSSTYALVHGSFLLLCVGGLMFGIANAVALYYRFAAADVADEAFKPKAISLVMGGGVAAALVGPEVATWSRDALLPYSFAGTFAMIAGLAVLNGLVLSFLAIPTPPRGSMAGGRPLSEIARQPSFVVAVMGGMVAYAVMSLVMTATPLAMAACQHPFADSAFVIQWHALGMFAPAFVTGHLIRRFGVLAVMQTGALLLGLAVAADLAGIGLWHFWTGLLLLGVGWNFLFVGGTALLTETYRPAERAKVQAINDFCVFAATATAALSAGALQHGVGWNGVNFAVIPLILVAIVSLLWLVRRRRGEAVAA